MKTLTFLFFFVLSTILSCTTKKETVVANRKTLNESGTTSCQLIEKKIINKGGKADESKELYLRCSVQDYFIKICEGNVTLQELEPYINGGITVKMEIREGMWDHCDKNHGHAQSRTGRYVVVKAIEK